MTNKPQENYPFSQWTIEWDYLKWVASEVRNAIMDVTWIYDEANSINEIEDILKLNHPRTQALYDYVTSSEENKEWYLENTENIKLVSDWIEILWDVFCLEDEKAEENGEDIWNNSWYTYFTFDSAQEHAKSQWKRVPSKDDWEKYTDFLPWSDKNKVNFLTQVLWLAFAGLRSWNNAYYGSQSTNADYWSSTPNSTNAYYLYFNASGINPAGNSVRGYAFSLRCLKN